MRVGENDREKGALVFVRRGQAIGGNRRYDEFLAPEGALTAWRAPSLVKIAN